MPMVTTKLASIQWYTLLHTCTLYNVHCRYSIVFHLICLHKVKRGKKREKVTLKIEGIEGKQRENKRKGDKEGKIRKKGAKILSKKGSWSQRTLILLLYSYTLLYSVFYQSRPIFGGLGAGSGSDP